MVVEAHVQYRLNRCCLWIPVSAMDPKSSRRSQVEQQLLEVIPRGRFGLEACQDLAGRVLRMGLVRHAGRELRSSPRHACYDDVDVLYRRGRRRDSQGVQ